jgi:isopenicillin-N N-acyltransferase-like protein
MSILPRTTLRVGLVWLIFASSVLRAGERSPYDEATYQKGELTYIHGLPVLIVEGTPEEIGRQKAALTAEAVRELADYPRRLFRQIGLADRWPKLVEMGRSLLPQFPPQHLRELRAFADKSGMDGELGLVANTMADTYRGGFGCSSLIVAADRSATGGPLFGRNLDFYTLGILDQYSLVTVYRPEGKHAFVSIGFPGLFGCLSGMNDAGLALAVHEVFLARDGSPMFNPKGTPYTFCFRRMLEECTSVQEAEALLRATERTTLLSLAVCDRRTAAVLEMTPKNVILRRGKEGVCVCTNHFRTDKLAFFPWCSRYNKLIKSRAMETIGLPDVAEKLREVGNRHVTVQTMIFEPLALNLHLAIGSCPASALPLRRLDLAPLFTAPRTAGDASAEAVPAGDHRPSTGSRPLAR